MLLVYEELNVGNNFLWIFLHFVFEQNLLVAFCMFNLYFNKQFCLFFHYFQSYSQLRLSSKNIKVIIDIRSEFHIIHLKSYKVPTFLPLVYISYYSWMFYNFCNWIFCHYNNVVGIDPISLQNSNCCNYYYYGNDPLCPLWSS